MTSQEQNIVETPSQEEIADAIRLLEANGFRVRSAAQVAASNASRTLMPKADPAMVKAYFASTGLSRKDLAAIVGVGVGVIATVQNPNGDRWSQARFDAAKVLIDGFLATTDPQVEVEAEAEAE